MPPFACASASLIGADHRSPLKEKNGQDAVFLDRVTTSTFGEVQICLVADGCGSGLHSEVGAKLGVRLLGSALARQLARASVSSEPPRHQFDRILDAARQDVLARLRILAQDMGGSFSMTVNDYFLFTIVGALITDSHSLFFSRGDGLVVVNGEEIWIQPLEGNAPVYLSYGLVETSLAKRPHELAFEIHRVVETAQLNHFLIATDGARFLSDAARLPMPGKKELVGPLCDLWETDRYFHNADALRRRLSLVNRPHVEPDWDGQRLIPSHGHLKDDLAVIVGRRIS